MDRDGRPAPHCGTCACDPTSAAALERTLRVPAFKLAKQSVMYCLVTKPSAHAALLEWWEAARKSGAKQPPRLRVEMVAHFADLEIIIHHAPPAPTSHRRTRNPRV